MKYNMWKRWFYVLCTAVIVFLSVLVTNIDYVSASDTYNYKTMWPALQQPWYFNQPNGIAVDSSGNVYVADTGNNRILKFSLSGQFIGKWRSRGTDDVSFSSYFWKDVFNGANLFDSFTWANSLINLTYTEQNVVIDDDGDGTGKEEEFNQ